MTRDAALWRTSRRDLAAAVALLAARGPIPGTDAAAALGWTLARWWAAISRGLGLWDVTARGLVLTAKGRRFLARLAPDPS